MSIHFPLDLDTDEVEFQLIALHTTLSGYQLGFWTNKILNLQLKNVTEGDDYESTQKAFSRFVYQDENKGFQWELIANKIQENTLSSPYDEVLFQIETKTEIQLIPSLKKVDFFLKIPLFTSVKNTLQCLTGIDNVTTAYLIEDRKIKLNNNLIFD